MALPLPNVVANVERGGPVVTSMLGGNALTNAILENQIKNVKAKYAPFTVPAEAASKLAYANLMGPQFLAKLLGNPDVLANIKNPQGKVNYLGDVATQPTGINALLQNPFIQSQNNSQSNSALANLVDNIRNAFGFNGGTTAKQNNVFSQQPNLSPVDRSAISNMHPGDSYVVQGDQGNEIQGRGPDSGYTYDKNGNNIVIPTTEINKILDQHEANKNNDQTFFEKSGRAAGIKKEGEKAGEIRAQDISDLSNTVFSGQTKQATLDNLSNIISSPAFEQMRQTPILGSHELSYYQRYGTPAQQNMVGQFITLSGNIIRDASQDFKGAFRKGEQELIQNMKVNPGDTFDAARGKIEELSMLNKMITQRAKLTGQYMEKYHISKLQAQDIADKQINGDAIRREVHNSLYPQPTAEDISFMAKKYNTTPDKIKEALKKKGYTLEIQLKGEK